MRSARNIIVIIVSLAILIALFYPLRAFNRGVRGGEDILVHEIPLAAFYLHTLRQGSFPLWNPHKACGIPAFEVAFMGPYYPAFLLYFLLPLVSAVNYGFLIHIFMSGLFVILLGRELQFNPVVALFCAFSWIFSSLFQQFSNSGWLAQTIAASYLPGLIYCFLKTLNSRYPQDNIFRLLAGLLVALIITGGVPHYSALIIYSFLIFCLPFFARRKAISGLLLVLGFGVLLSIVYWGPLAIQLRGAIINARKDIIGYSLEDLGNFVSPFVLRRGFAGRLVLILGLAGLFLKGPYARNLRVLFGLSLVLILAQNSIPGVRWINYLPLVNKDRYAWPWHTGLIFSLVLLSGSSLERLCRRLSGRKKMLFTILSIVTALQLSDLYLFGRRECARRGDYEFAEYFPDRPLAEYLKKDGSLFRISNEHYDFAGFRDNQGLLSGISCFESRIRGMNSYRLLGENRSHYYLDNLPGGLLRDISNIKYLIARQELSDPELVRVGEIPDFYLYRNEAHYPRAFLIEGASPDRVEEDLIENYSGTLLSMSVRDGARELLAKYSPVEIEWFPNRYRIVFDSDRGGVLFLSEMFCPGWRAVVASAAAPIIRPFNFFMAVSVPPGKQSVIFQFRPRYFYACALISSATGIIWLLMIVHYVRRCRRGAGGS